MEVTLEKDKEKNIRRFIITTIIVLLFSPAFRFVFGDTWQFGSLKNFIDSNLYAYIVSFAFWGVNANMGRWTGRKLNWDKSPKRANAISLSLIIFTGISLSILIPFFYLKYYEKIPAEKLLYKVTSYAFITLAIDLIFIATYYAGYLATYWEKSIRDNEALKRENLLAEYEALKSQVNPHFLFNSLNTLAGVVEKSPEKATEYINKLSMIYRYVLDHRNKDFIPLEEELNFLDDFIYLSKIRYGNGLIIQNEIKGDNKMIIPMALQLLLENAIKHNEISLENPLTVRLYTTNDFICIQNNLQPKSSIQKTNKVGLENLTKRYEYLNSRKVEVEQNATYFEVRLPLIKPNNK